METKLAILKRLMSAGDHRAALKLAASWGKRGLGGGEHAEAITRGWEAIARPEFYRSIGKVPEELVAAGIAAIKERYQL